MRPTKLETDFIRTLRDVTLDLSEVTAATIVGQNGAGKSTIVECIFTALFGDGRSILPSNMISLGEESGSILLEFEHGIDKYRIIRQGGKRSDLQLLVNTVDQGWNAIGGANATETQAKICEILAMDRDLFAASSFVGQGGSAGLCDMKPAQRKELMYAIYEREIGVFARKFEVAKERRKKLDTRIDVESNLNSILRADVGKLESVQEELEAVKIEVQTAKGKVDTTRSELNKANDLEASRGDLVKRRSDQTTTMHEKMQQQRGVDEELVKVQKDIRETQVLLDGEDNIRAKCTEADELEKTLEVFEKARVLDAQKMQAKITREGELKLEQVELNRRLSQQLDQIKTTMTQAERDSQAEEQAASSTQNRIDDVKRRAGMKSSVPCREHDSFPTECPLLKDARDAEKQLPALEEDLDRHTQKAQEHQKVYLDAKLKHEQWTEDAAKELAAMSEKVNAEIARLVDEIYAVGYDPKLHAQAQSRYSLVKLSRESLPKLAAALERFAALDKEQERLIGEHNRLEGEIKSCQGHIDDLDADLRLIETKDIPQLETLLQFQEAAQGETLQKQGALQNKIEEILGKKEALGQSDDELSMLKAELQVVQQLELAYSRNGIPALIIDAVIPQIEDTANELLYTLSGGRMSVKFTTQKQTGSGLAECLDIWVRDGQGERPYEDFSGGEKLRVNLAIRIAIGQVLARRAGSTIRTLVLDEVCSPLDVQGEDALVECILRLQQMFDCILLITHRESLKDRLPQQIIVTKNGQGSTVELVS